MKEETLRAISEIETLTPEDWQHLREQAASKRVGSEWWESAWLAARAGHAAGTAAQVQALRAGASLLAAAAVAGAVAALEARDQLTNDRFTTLTEPAIRVLRPPDRPWRRWRPKGRCRGSSWPAPPCRSPTRRRRSAS